VRIEIITDDRTGITRIRGVLTTEAFLDAKGLYTIEIPPDILTGKVAFIEMETGTFGENRWQQQS